MSFLGAALGISMQVYLTLNLPDFFDAGLITVSLERGLIVGSIFGLGIFITRVITERFQASRALLRVIFGTITGGIGLNIALFIFHILFVKTAPQSFLITTGCMMIALTVSVGGFFRSRLPGMVLSSASILLAIVGTWWIHINYATSNVELTPIFRYDPNWTLAQVSFTALSVALLVGIFGNLVSLTIKDE